MVLRILKCMGCDLSLNSPGESSHVLSQPYHSNDPSAQSQFPLDVRWEWGLIRSHPTPNILCLRHCHPKTGSLESEGSDCSCKLWGVGFLVNLNLPAMKSPMPWGKFTPGITPLLQPRDFTHICYWNSDSLNSSVLPIISH